MKILLVNPPYINFEGIRESGGHMMPLNIAYLASYLRKKNPSHEISILDTEAMGINYEQIRQELVKYKPDLVGFTCLTPVINHVFEIAKLMKEINPSCKTIAGGIHPTTLPKETIACPYLDFVAIGEGEITFSELVEKLNQHEKDFSQIAGLCYKEDGTIRINKPRDFIANLDEIPFPARDLFKLDLYYSAPTKKVSNLKATPILMSRGCAYRCTHCISQGMWKCKVRYRSIPNVIGEINECINFYGMGEFNVYDDNFTLKEERALKICDEIINRDFKIAWVCFSRVNTISDRLAERMAQAGCKKISFGLESGSQEILNLMKKQATVEMGRQAVSTIRRHGILAHGSFMFGNLGETEETIKKTIKFAKSLDLDNATFFITSPVPGSELYEIAKKLGYANENTKWENFAPLTNTDPILVQNQISAKELIKWQKRAFREFYIRPKYFLHKIKQLRSLDTLKMIAEGLRVFYRIIKK